MDTGMTGTELLVRGVPRPAGQGDLLQAARVMAVLCGWPVPRCLQ